MPPKHTPCALHSIELELIHGNLTAPSAHRSGSQCCDSAHKAVSGSKSIEQELWPNETGRSFKGKLACSAKTSDPGLTALGGDPGICIFTWTSSCSGTISSMKQAQTGCLSLLAAHSFSSHSSSLCATSGDGTQHPHPKVCLFAPCRTATPPEVTTAQDPDLLLIQTGILCIYMTTNL